jgi:hypothetical protein
MIPPDPVLRQAQAADAVSRALAGNPEVQKVTLYVGRTFSLITAYLDIDDRFIKLRIEVHIEGE